MRRIRPVRDNLEGDNLEVDNLEALGRAALGQAPYPVWLDEMLANVRSFEVIQRSVKSGTIEGRFSQPPWPARAWVRPTQR